MKYWNKFKLGLMRASDPSFINNVYQNRFNRKFSSRNIVKEIEGYEKARGSYGRHSGDSSDNLHDSGCVSANQRSRAPISKLMKQGNNKDKKMLGAISTKPKKKDLRFVDPERSKSRQTSSVANMAAMQGDAMMREGVVPSWTSASAAIQNVSSVPANEMDVNILKLVNEKFKQQQARELRLNTIKECRAARLKSNSSLESEIALKIENDAKHATKISAKSFPFSKVEHLNDVSKSDVSKSEVSRKTSRIDDSASLKLRPTKKAWPQFDDADFKNSIGVFSDTKSYSALIKNELLQHKVNVKHFHHPSTFTADKYERFDKINAWLIFISDEDNDSFIEAFIDRYAEKPALFLCPKMNRLAASTKMAEFLSDNQLSFV